MDPGFSLLGYLVLISMVCYCLCSAEQDDSGHVSDVVRRSLLWHVHVDNGIVSDFFPRHVVAVSAGVTIT